MSRVKFHSCSPYFTVAFFTEREVVVPYWESMLVFMQANLMEGAELFNAGHWWEAHEAWEGPWMQAQGQERQFIQGLILLAAALHKRWYHGNMKGRNFEKALVKLSDVPDEFGGVNLARLKADVRLALEVEGLRPQIPLQ